MVSVYRNNIRPLFVQTKYIPMPNLSATPGKYQTGSTANFVTASSPELFRHILPSGILVIV